MDSMDSIELPRRADNEGRGSPVGLIDAEDMRISLKCAERQMEQTHDNSGSQQNNDDEFCFISDDEPDENEQQNSLKSQNDIPLEMLGLIKLEEPPTKGPEIEFKPRRYEKELAEPALKGQNCIIAAPTGSGKTYVAIFIIRKHLKKNKDAKVLFIVPTVALVDQQKKQITKFTEGLGVKVFGLFGAMEILLEDQINSSANVVVLTPQILVDQKDPNFLQKLSLIIFDECHHTIKGHAYNQVMSRYIQIRHERQNVLLPQIVGLTASIGVGNPKDMDEANSYVEGICANLDCAIISTVIENTTELQGHVNKPEGGVIEVNRREEDPFNDEVNRIMEVIETKMQELPEKEIGCFGEVIKSPYKRGCDPYIPWLGRIKNNVSTIQRKETRSFFITCVDWLEIYNNSLMINTDCRTKDAVDYIKSEIKAHKFHLPNEINEFFMKLWTEKQDQLMMITYDDAYKNPFLECEKKILLDCFEEDINSRCIIFCKTREIAAAHVKWMLETPELKCLNPTKFVGINAPRNREGMTSAQQNNVLELFKGGKHKVIVATSVAEEGLDVQNCNVVIRYKHVTDAISRSQSMGRARQESSKYIVIAERGSRTAGKESTNEIQEAMMERAIKNFQNLGIDERKDRIRKLQIDRKNAEDVKRLFEELNNKLRTGEEYEIRCFKCDNLASLSSDVRKIKNSHHVIMDPTIKKRISIKPASVPKDIDSEIKITGQIFCSECRCDWGIMAIHKDILFPVIKISSFIVKKGSTQNRFKKWKDVPFCVKPFDDKDLQKAALLPIFQIWKDSWNLLDISFSSSDNFSSSA